MVRIVFGAVRRWRGPEGWPVPGHCAQGLGPPQYTHRRLWVPVTWSPQLVFFFFWLVSPESVA